MMIIKYLNQDPEENEVVPKYKGEEGKAAVSLIVKDINSAVGQRMVSSDNIVDLRRTTVLSDAGLARLLAPKESTKYNFADLKFFFRASGFLSKPDTAGLYPLQGIRGKTSDGVIKLIGTETTDNQSDKLSFSDWLALNEITTFFSEAKDAKKYPNYNRRILGFHLKGIATNNTQQEALLVPGKLGELAFQAPEENTPANRASAFRQKVVDFNARRGPFYVGSFTAQPNLALKTDRGSEERKRVVNAAGHVFAGNSSSYISSFYFFTGQRQRDISFNADNVASVEFGLDFEQVKNPDAVGGETGAYEMNFQSTTSSSDLAITQSTNGVTINLPPVLFGIGGTTSPVSFNMSESNTRQKGKTLTSQIAERLTMKLPKVYYRVRNFTGTPLEAVRAIVTITQASNSEPKPNTKLLVPLGQKVLLAADVDGVAQKIVLSI